MRTARKLEPIGIDAFIAWEDAQTERHELVSGEIFAMVGGTLGHSDTIGNLYVALRSRLMTPCRAYAQDVKVRVDAAGSVYYPDVVVSCVPQVRSSTVLREPILVAEVLSPSTEKFDRAVKRADYARIPSVRYILLVDADERRVELDRRDPDGGWTLETVTESCTLELPELGLVLDLDEIYGG